MKRYAVLLVATAFACVALVGTGTYQAQEGKKMDTRIFELRTYYTNPGKMAALHARFRDHTNKLFVKHGMTLIGYWNPIDPKQAEEKLVYILAFPSKEAADRSWHDFQNDPVWKGARAKSEENGPLVKKVERVFMRPTDYSPIK